MAAGGKRPGAGRKKGAPNKASAKREAEIAKSGKTPLQFLLDRMRDTRADISERIDCAKAAAPYVHPRLASVEYGGKGGGPMEVAHRHLISADHYDKLIGKLLPDRSGGE